VIRRTKNTSSQAAALSQFVKDKLVEHTRYIEENGIDLPEILNWKWSE
jgi:xylulose-5-phosphate/fructose-6-phosphate phosphoketolase